MKAGDGEVNLEMEPLLIRAIQALLCPGKTWYYLQAALCQEMDVIPALALLSPVIPTFVVGVPCLALWKVACATKEKPPGVQRLHLDECL